MKQRKRNKVRVRGVAQRNDNGRPELVYGRRCSPGEEVHETRVADLELLLHCRIERDAKVGKTQADGVAIISGNRCYIEVDNSGKQTLRKQLQDKIKRYEGVTDAYVLIIAVTESRMQKIREWSAALKELAFFSTFDRLKHCPQPFIDWYGDKVKL